MGWLTAITTAAKVIGAVKSKPKKGEAEKLSPLAGAAFDIGLKGLKDFVPYKEELDSLIGDFMAGPEASKWLGSISRADFAQSQAELNYADVKQNLTRAAGQQEAEMQTDILATGAEFDNNKILTLFAKQKQQQTGNQESLYAVGQGQGAYQEQKLASKYLGKQAAFSFLAETSAFIREKPWKD